MWEKVCIGLPGKSNRMMKNIVVSIFAIITITLQHYVSYAEEYIVIVKEDVNIRLEPNTNSTVLATGQKGDIFRIAESEGDWYSIYMFSGEIRYIYKPLTEKILEVPELPESTELKKKVYKELSDAKDRAATESYEEYPNDIFKQIDMERRLNDKYKLPAFQKHAIPPARYHQLMGDGLKNNW